MRSEESLAFYIYREPRRAKRLHIGVIPRAVDEYWQFRGNIRSQPIEQKLGNPVHHIHAGKVPAATLPLTYGAAAQPRRLPRRRQGYGLEVRPALCARHVARDQSRARRADRLRGQLRPRFRRADASSAARRARRGRRAARPRRRAGGFPTDADAEDIQHTVYEVGKRHPFESLRDWFQALYETLLGSSQGPRMGSFIALYGIDNSNKARRELRPTERQGLIMAEPDPSGATISAWVGSTAISGAMPSPSQSLPVLIS